MKGAMHLRAWGRWPPPTTTPCVTIRRKLGWPKALHNVISLLTFFEHLSGDIRIGSGRTTIGLMMMVDILLAFLHQHDHSSRHKTIGVMIRISIKDEWFQDAIDGHRNSARCSIEDWIAAIYHSYSSSDSGDCISSYFHIEKVKTLLYREESLQTSSSLPLQFHQISIYSKKLKISYL
ncbi:unnamed protein product [Dovyalis caffra]|uniref:Uncharacterized protein n=1 Tax=Dovyalis caffra TaxID=77055 RepID=A0AAV1S758_9ROSI|nr:unnamed protein product [Dovyalis caffra]